MRGARSEACGFEDACRASLAGPRVRREVRMIDREPISESALQARIAQCQARMSEAQTRLWEAVRMRPEKWQQHPYGDQGGGFWVVGLIGGTVIWYNDIEEGFNRSRFSTFGIIDDYWCNHDELETTLQYLMTALNRGHDMVRLVRNLRGAKR
jgi:hypothetical protein